MVSGLCVQDLEDGQKKLTAVAYVKSQLYECVYVCQQYVCRRACVYMYMLYAYRYVCMYVFTILCMHIYIY